jgi:hypothetical protein
MKASDLWMLCNQYNVTYFSKENRQYWKTRLVVRPKRQSDGTIHFSTADTLLGLTKITEHILDFGGHWPEHFKKRDGMEWEVKSQLNEVI